MQLAQMIENVSRLASWLYMFWSRTHELYKPTAKEVADIIRQSPVFTCEAEGLLTEGIEAYLKGDHIKAIHVFIPQIEAGLRTLLGLLGIPTNKPMRSSKGVMQAKNLNDVLGDPNVKEILGDDAVLYLQTFLNTDPGVAEP